MHRLSGVVVDADDFPCPKPAQAGGHTACRHGHSDYCDAAGPDRVVTVDPPDHDPSLEGHPGVERDGTLHALRRRYPGMDETAETECGIDLAAWSDVIFRGAYDDSALCPECWPDGIRG